MSDSKAREAARLAFAMKEVSGTSVPFETMIDAAIDAYLAALGETHAVVPRNPTVAMIRALTATWDEEGKAQVAKWSLGTFAEDYSAMLKAAKTPKAQP